MESQTFRVGQEVEVTYRARVAEVDAGIGRPRAGVRLRLEALAPAVTGWVEPSSFGGFSIKVVSEAPLPTEPGMYAKAVVREPRPAESEDDFWETDGLEFFYLNEHGNWCDVGWGSPAKDDGADLQKWSPHT